MKPYLLPYLFIITATFACKDSNSGVNNHNQTPAVKDTIKSEVNNVDDKEFLISDNRAGHFKIGDELPGPVTMMKYKMRMEQMPRHTDDGPHTETVTILSDETGDLVWLKPGVGDDNKTISEILVISPKFKTAENIGISSSIADFQNAYPDFRIWYTYVSSMYVIETGKVKAQFILDGNDHTEPKPEIKSEITPLKISDFKNSARIQRVRII